MAAFALQEQLHTFTPAKTAYRTSITCQAYFLSRAVYDPGRSSSRFSSFTRILYRPSWAANSLQINQKELIKLCAFSAGGNRCAGWAWHRGCRELPDQPSPAL